MGWTSRHLSIGIDRSAGDVYEFAADPRNLPAWASGLAGSDVQAVGDRWSTRSPMGAVTFSFAPANEFGVLDHEVTLPTGETVYNPMRVIRDGEGAEVIFSLRRVAGHSDADFEHDAATVAKDLATLKSVLEVDEDDRVRPPAR